MRQLNDLKSAEIKAAVMEVFPEDGHAEAYQLLDAVAEHLGSGRSSEALPSGFGASALGTKALDRYVGRVKRALDALALDGILVRVGAMQRLPDGAGPFNEVHYYTPDAFSAAQARYAKRLADAELEEERWARIAVRLLGEDISLRGDRTIGASEWERLLDRAGL